MPPLRRKIPDCIPETAGPAVFSGLLWGLEVNTVIPLYAVTLLFVLFAFVLVPFVVRYEKRLPKAQRAPKEAMGKAGKKQKASAHGKPEGPA